MTVYSHFGSKEGLFEAVVQDRTDRVMGGSAGVEALDPMQPRKALLAVGEQFLALTREERHTRQVPFAVWCRQCASRGLPCAFYRQGPERLNRVNWPPTCSARTTQAR